jgi:hypothetical protein
MKKYFFYLPTHYLEGRVAKGETNNFLRLASWVQSPDWVKPKTKKLVFVASSLRAFPRKNTR